MSDTKTIEEELVLGEPELKQISQKVSEDLKPELEASTKTAAAEAAKTAVDEVVESTVKKVAEDVFEAGLEKIEKTIKKAVPAETGKDTFVAKGLESGKLKQEIADMSPAMRFYAGVKALTAGEAPDLGLLRQINAFNIAAQKDARAEVAKEGQEAIAKTGYANETTAADGAVLIPDPEFVLTLFDNLPKYGVAFANADVRQTDRNAVRVISLDTGLTFYSTAEGGVKTSAKLAFAKNEVSLVKYAVIVPASDEFTDDAAIDYWNVVTRELSRAYALIVDQKTFTDPTTGITNVSGVLTQTTGAGASSLDWDDLLVAEGKTEDDLDTSNFAWYLRKETWFALIQKKGTTNDHYIAGSLAFGWTPNPNSPQTPWGTPVKFTRVLPTINTVSANDAIGVYGDLRNLIVYNKRGMQMTTSSEASIVDADGSTTNLFTQDISALRAVVRFLIILPKGNRTKFVILGTGTVS